MAFYWTILQISSTVGLDSLKMIWYNTRIVLLKCDFYEYHHLELVFAIEHPGKSLSTYVNKKHSKTSIYWTILALFAHCARPENTKNISITRQL